MVESDRVVLITGSSRGLGKAMALEFGERGYTVAVQYEKSRDSAQEVAKAIKALGARASVFRSNVSNAKACKVLIERVSETLGKIDVLVNNAAIVDDQLAIRMKDEQWKAVIDTDLSSAFYLSKVALRGMIRGNWGRIINISSVVGITGNTGQANYVAAKAGLVGLTKVLALEYASKGITVNAVSPGLFETEMTDRLSEKQREAYRARIPADRFGKPEEIAKVVAFLASEDAAYINGQTITVDGGMVMQ